MKKSFKNGGLFATLLLAGFAFIYFVSANAAEGDAEDKAYHECAEEVSWAWAAKSIEEQDRDVCAYFKVPVGKECEMVLENMLMQGGPELIRMQMTVFIYDSVIVPACGHHKDH